MHQIRDLKNQLLIQIDTDHISQDIISSLKIKLHPFHDNFFEIFDNGEDFILLDVREDAEFEVARIDGSTHIPMSVLIGRLDEINKEKKIIAMCHTGMRSMQVCMYLKNEGYNMTNLLGGIDAWSKEIDKKVKIY